MRRQEPHPGCPTRKTPVRTPQGPALVDVRRLPGRIGLLLVLPVNPSLYPGATESVPIILSVL
eukprot:7789761-Pyramimonas_sp.AAC.1